MFGILSTNLRESAKQFSYLRFSCRPVLNLRACGLYTSKLIKTIPSHSSSVIRSVRQYQHGQKPLDINANVLNDTVIYSFKNDRFFKMMTIFGITQFLFWLNIASFTYTAAEEYQTVETPFTEKKMWEQIMVHVKQHKTKVPIMCCIMGR